MRKRLQFSSSRRNWKMSSKNELQEYCQKRNIPTPKYVTKFVGGEPHAPLWQSTAFIGGQGTSFTFLGKVFSSKKKAELSAANKAMEYIDKIKIKSIVSINPSDQHTEKTSPIVSAILVDVENATDSLKDLLQGPCITGVDIYLFFSTANPFIEKYTDVIQEHKLKMIEVPSKHRDAADVALTLAMGRFVERMKYKNYFIITRDHFADALVECLYGICNDRYLGCVDVPFLIKYESIFKALDMIQMNE